MSNTREAAERLRLAFECEEFSFDIADLLQSDVDPQLPKDLVAVAKAYVAEVDDEPISPEWLDETFHSREYGHSSWVLDEVGNVYGFFHGSGFVLNRVEPHASISGIETRGQLRLLLRALGGDKCTGQ